MAFLGSVLPAVILTAQSAAAFTPPPSQVNFNLQACRNDGTIKLPIAGQFVCPDAAYVSGNLGKGWNELDLVPYRLTTTNSTSSAQTYDVIVAGDNQTSGKTGYDVISAGTSGSPAGPTINSTLSDPSCSATWGPQLTQGSPAQPFGGGTDVAIYRDITVTQNAGTTCVLDYYMRLALGAHLYPGSSLQGYMFQSNDFKTGKKTISINVNEISPQQLSKTMSATQAQSQIWNVVKGANPANLAFSDTCSATAGSTSAPTNVTITWTKLGISPVGDITVVTDIYATNPAARSVNISVSDQIFSGTTALGSPSTASATVPANTMNFLVLTHMQTVPSGTTNLNDIATASYTDTVTGQPVPGTTTATASATVQSSGVLNTSAVISDVEHLTGSGFSYAVGAPTGTGAAGGSFGGGYTASTTTTADVSWTSASQTSSGSVTFPITVFAAVGTIATGSLSDTATLTGSDGFTASEKASVSLSANTLESLEISKTLSPASSEALDFHFNVTGPNGYSNAVTLHFPAGATTEMTTLTGLAPGSYTVAEPGNPPFAPQSTNVVINPADCMDVVTFTNQFNPPLAAVQKLTNPGTNTDQWSFVLSGPGIPGGSVSAGATANAGYTIFPPFLADGTYTITEQPTSAQASEWDLTNVAGSIAGGSGTAPNGSVATQSCTFTVDQIADHDSTFQCSFTNTARGHLVVKKVTQPNGASQSFSFSSSGPNSFSQQFNLMDGGSHDSGALSAAGGYSVAEAVPTGWDQTGATCDNGNDPTNVTVSPGSTVTCTFTNTERGHIVIEKITDPASTQSFPFTLTGGPSVLSESFNLTNGGQQDSGGVLPGDGYFAAEMTPAGWDQSNTECSNGSPVTDIAVGSGETVTCVFTNTERAHIIIKKQTVPAGSSQSFAFTLTGGPSALNNSFPLTDGQTSDSGAILPGSGYSAAETVPTGWDQTNASCSNGSPVTNIAVNPGETVICTFTNTERAHIIIKKQTVPAGSSQSFAFTLSGGPSALNNSFPLTDGQTSDSGAILPGSGYSAAETIPDGWDQTGATCDNGSPVTNIAVNAGQTVTCTFTNTQRAHIVIVKKTVPSGASQTFAFTLTGGPSALNATFGLTNGESNDSGAILPGSGYVAAETIPDGWDQTGATCDNGSPVTNIAVNAGQTVTCTFTNTQRAHIVIVKKTVPSGASQTFAFTLTGGPSALNATFGLTNGESNDSGAILPGGGYVAAETVPAGWDQTGATCDNGSPVTNIAVNAGQTVTCTFTNTERGQIIVKKVTNPSSDPQSFAFTLTGGPSPLNASFGLTDGQSNESGFVLPGDGYVAAETVPDGWVQTSATCDNSSPVTGITVNPGQTVTCTFINTKDAHLIVKKVTIPSGDPQQFAFTSSGPGGFSQAFNLSDGQSHDSGAVVPGTGYNAAETLPTGWDQTGATCDNGNSPTNVSLNPGQTVNCTFSNTKRAHLIVVKMTDPASTQSFAFSTAGPNGFSQSFNLTNGQSKDSGPVLPGTGYSAAETLPPGWDQSKATCDDGDSPTNITLQAGQTVTCTFVNSEQGQIIIKKKTVPAGDPQSFAFTLIGGPSALNQAFPLTDGQSQNIGFVLPGSGYAAAETVPAGWDQTSATCDNGSPATNISVALGQTVTCTFTNTKRAHLIIKKVTVPSGNPQVFSFSSSGPGGFSQSFGLSDGQSHDSGAVPAGTGYSVGETVPSGWDQTGATCDNGNSPTNVTLAAGQTVTCTFTNTKRPDVTVVKTENGGVPTMVYTFTLSGAGISTVTLTTSSTNHGTLDFGVLKPGAYTLCELNVPAGTTSTLQSFPGATVDPTSGNICAPITVTGGANIVIHVDNTHPLGGQRTIGYWKNWNTCSGSSGNQIKNAGATGHVLLDQLLPITLVPASGTYAGVTISTCTQGVDVLSSASSKYAEHQLAAQLLAALANVKVAKGMACTAANMAIAQAQSLLQQIKWNGQSTTAIVGANSALRTQFTNVANTLNQFNNAQLC